MTGTLGSQIATIDTTNLRPETKVYLCATNNVQKFSPVSITFQVCGTEEVSLTVSTMKLSYEYDLNVGTKIVPFSAFKEQF